MKTAGLRGFDCEGSAPKRSLLRVDAGLPGQIVLDPQAIPADGPTCPAPAVLPKAVRQLGYLPDIERIRPGDLILFSAVPGRLQTLKDALGIPAVQERGGYALPSSSASALT